MVLAAIRGARAQGRGSGFMTSQMAAANTNLLLTADSGQMAARIAGKTRNKQDCRHYRTPITEQRRASDAFFSAVHIRNILRYCEIICESYCMQMIKIKINKYSLDSKSGF